MATRKLRIEEYLETLPSPGGVHERRVRTYQARVVDSVRPDLRAYRKDWALLLEAAMGWCAARVVELRELTDDAFADYLDSLDTDTRSEG